MSTCSLVARKTALCCDVLQSGSSKSIRDGSESIVGDEFAAERIFAAEASDGKLSEKLQVTSE